MITVASPVEPRTLDESAEPNERIGVRAYAVIAIQVALVLGVALSYRLELERGFTVVATLILVGFLVHSWLPLRVRLPFFLLLSAAAIGFLLRTDGVWLLGIGVALIALCHLPVAWSIRVGLLLMATTGLVAIRSDWIAVAWGDAVLPVLAAIFMFRLILYIYDLKEDRTPANIWQRLSYFFLLPNVCFPLFPVVDYKTFLRTYYDAPAAEIYQKGVFWMFRGVTHLLLYRLVYFLLPRAETDLPGLLGVYVFMAMTYALYLRVSGLFHLIVGSLCLFGFNLPVTNNHYFLASSFNDLWRRINIYWKDFMMTTAFYPVFMGARRLEMALRLVIATGFVFFVTWFLHSYQWFWLQGVFPVALTDILFWGVLGVALAINSVWEARQGRKRRGRGEGSIREGIQITIRILGVFSLMAVIWSLWNSSSLSEWMHRILQARTSGPHDLTLLAGLGLMAMCTGALIHRLNARDRGPARLERIARRHSPFLVPTTAAALILIGQPGVHMRLGGPTIALVTKAQSTSLNAIDMRRQERGYYEALSRATQFGAPSMTFGAGEWVGISDTPAAELTRDIRGVKLKPNVEIRYRGSTLSTNKWGLRDRDYDRIRPPTTFRIALIGPSTVMGSGVMTDQTFENLIEDSLNRHLVGRGFQTYEILNFSVTGYGALEALYVVRNIVPEFDPQVIMYVIHPGEGYRMIDRLRLRLHVGNRMDLDPETQLAGFAPILAVLKDARATSGLPPEEFQRRLGSRSTDLLFWTYQAIAEATREQGATPVFALIPLTERDFEAEERRLLTGLARQAGGVVLELESVFEGYKIEDLRIADWDNHPNELGHRLIADKLYAAMIGAGGELGLSGSSSPGRIDDPREESR